MSTKHDMTKSPTEYASDEYEPEITDAALVAQDAILSHLDATEILAPVLVHVAEVARAHGEYDAVMGPFETSEGADEALINAMGADWIVRRCLGIDAESLDSDTIWQAIQETFCAAYTAGVECVTGAQPS